ncbi:TetR/AcrR family transcriptional regulator [Streptococcus loxodontisalivarius]|uniref:AcrR family transcriptional regulator n=1 Tax=Streptococcus loxodontisalivarius TaxID=1349415 RepID=A0ABS2PTI2_9STRE|nr:TetR/AcrR family transcriptional regulator [Streptococcus loxodontisalivarius]MBM7643351.1 AcrR family transcriptional regulator [Streptococcus loxodontisalivarius]
MTPKRQTGTKKQIKLAVAKLFQEKSFEEISVTMICRQANINRGTFYLHYLDKFDLMDKIKDETLADIKAIITDQEALFTKKVINKALHYIIDDFEFIFAIAKSNYINFPASIREFLEVLMSTSPNTDQELEKHYQIPLHYAKISYIASLEAIISEWISRLYNFCSG